MEENESPFEPQKDEGLFNERIKRFCTAAGVSKRSELGGVLGLKPTSIGTALGRRVIPPHWYFILADKQDVSIDWLYSGKGEMHGGPRNEKQSLQEMIVWIIETFKSLGAENEQIREAIIELLKSGTPKSE